MDAVPEPTVALDDTAPTAAVSVAGRALPRWLRRAWPVLRFVIGFGLAALALWVLAGHRSELQGITEAFDHLDWWWVPVAVGAEGFSLLAFTFLQRRLLRAGHLGAPLRPLFNVGVASQAITTSFPAGPAVAAVYGFRWYRRFGADEGLAAWTVVGVIIAASVSLALLAAAGVALAAAEGASLDLIGVVIGVLLVSLAFGALFVYERPLAVVATWLIRTSRRLTGRPRGDLAETIQEVVRRITLVRLGWKDVSVVVGWGLANWGLDCAVFAFSFLVIGSSIPWKGLLLAYGAGQLAANLPITPGGLGAVEGSITIALVAFGGERDATVDAVIIYRLISFWLVLVVGWLACGFMAWGVRRGRWPRHVIGAPDDVAVAAPVLTAGGMGERLPGSAAT